MKMHTMRKADVLASWVAMILDVRASNRMGNPNLGPCTDAECIALLRLLRANWRVGSLRTFSVVRAKTWAGECAELVRKGEA